DVKQSADYTIGGLVAAVDEGSRITFTLDDGTTTGPRALPWTHSSSVWHHADNLGTLLIDAGPRVLTMHFETANVNVEYLTLTAN
ncbi:MAG TPA: carbohydrate-binding domain-containing protein, partial [Polyangia bacterium]|nr:carbohydrate-binding domain-containing protein [Polyangia bacterium]